MRSSHPICIALRRGREDRARAVHRAGAAGFRPDLRRGVPRHPRALPRGRGPRVRLDLGQRAPRVLGWLPALAPADARRDRGRDRARGARDRGGPRADARSPSPRRGRRGRGQPLRRPPDPRARPRVARGGVPHVRRPAGPAAGAHPGAGGDPPQGVDGRTLLVRGQGASLRGRAGDPAAGPAGRPPIYLGGFDEKTDPALPDALPTATSAAARAWKTRRRPCAWAEEGAREAGKDPEHLGFALLQNAFVARDRDEAWARVRDGVNHQIGVYAAWRDGADTPGHGLDVPDVGDEDPEAPARSTARPTTSSAGWSRWPTPSPRGASST